VDARQSWKLMIAEDLDNNASITRAHVQRRCGFDAQWDAELREAVRAAITQATDGSIDVGRIATALERSSGSDDVFKKIIYLESHDEAKSKRVPDVIFPGNAEGWHARKKSMLGAGIVLTAAGMPMLFQGFELLDWRRWSDATTIDWSRKTQFPDCFSSIATWCDCAPTRPDARVGFVVPTPT
jgi:1,4-alpha-glucan branching enzyme